MNHPGTARVLLVALIFLGISGHRADVASGRDLQERELYSVQEPGTPEESDEEKNSDQRDESGGAATARHRVIFSDTALPHPPKQLTLTGYMGGLWHAEYGINDHLSVGAFANLPVMMVGFAPTVRAQTGLTENISVAAGVMAGGITSYIKSHSLGFFGFGMEGTVTFLSNNKRHLINVSTLAAKVGFHEEGYVELLREVLITPKIGYSYQLNQSWKLSAEVSNPFFAPSEALFGPGHVWLISYGASVQGETWFSDFGFLLPIQDDFVNSLWKFMPLGVPCFTIGFKL